ncbi:MAG TPA: B12-binding domain-containing radical SAM protein [Candidatus Wunengus sp. YC60]|uniref:B12-binding domain-containing radical SAM protein n=1 Tax=Candidatus Wunengus sp. YC60 TaxID=3367697 RepID=UPI0040250473
MKRRFGSKLIIFGAHITGIPEKTLEMLPEIDIGILGEPEFVVQNIIKKRDFQELREINNITYRDAAGKIIVNKRIPLSNGLDNLPTPAWDMLPLEKYTLPFTGEKYLLIETSRGCPFSCDFCVAPLYHGTVFRQKKTVSVVDEIETLKRKFKINAFYLWGDTVTLSKKFISEVCDEIIRRKLNIRWFSNSRADTISDLELVKKMKASGCWMLSIGIESFNEKTLDSIQKKLSVEKIINSLNLLNKVGIISFGFFILGHPDETKADIAKTVKLALKLPLDYANFYPAVPYPGTQFYEKCVKNNYLINSNAWEKMDYSNYILKTNEFDEATVMREISQARRKFYLRTRFIIRHIKFIGIFKTLTFTIKYIPNFIARTLKQKYLDFLCI